MSTAAVISKLESQVLAEYAAVAANLDHVSLPSALRRAIQRTAQADQVTRPRADCLNNAQASIHSATSAKRVATARAQARTSPHPVQRSAQLSGSIARRTGHALTQQFIHVQLPSGLSSFSGKSKPRRRSWHERSTTELSRRTRRGASSAAGRVSVSLVRVGRCGAVLYLVT